MSLDWTILHGIHDALTGPFLDFLMPKITSLGNGGAKKVLPLVGTFVVTCISGLIYAVIFACFVQRNPQLIMVMAPVVAMTGAFNAIIVQALYVPIKKSLNK